MVLYGFNSGVEKETLPDMLQSNGAAVLRDLQDGVSPGKRIAPACTQSISMGSVAGSMSALETSRKTETPSSRAL